MSKTPGAQLSPIPRSPLSQYPPPSPFFVGDDDQLTINSWNSVSGVVISVTLRVLAADPSVTQRVEYKDFQHIPNTNRTIATSNNPLQQSYILSAAAAIAVGSVSGRGRCFVQAGITKKGVTGLYGAPLLQGYVGSGMAPGWPYSRIADATEGTGRVYNVAPSNPSAGAEISVTVPTGARWRLISMVAKLTTSTVVNTREPTVLIQDGSANNVGYWPANSTVVASSNRTYSWPGGTQYASAGAPAAGVIPIQPNEFIPAGGVIKTSTANLDAADTWTAIGLQVEEWIEP